MNSVGSLPIPTGRRVHRNQGRHLGLYAAAPLAALLALAAVVVPQPSQAAPGVPAAKATRLVGTLQLTAGKCAGGKVTGTYLRMILPSGGPNGPYMANNDSSCSDQSITPLAPGTDGGLKVGGAYQPPPSPVFDSSGNARANRLTAPAPFYGTSFATGTTKVDRQTKKAVPAPSATVTGSTLTADLRAFAVTWNNQDFNQGAPKPDGSTPGNTRSATGTYDAATGAFTLHWTSQVVGGPFDKFTGSWYFVGKFVPAAGTKPPAASGNGGSAGGTANPGTTANGAGTGTAVPNAPTSPGAIPTGANPGDVPGAAPVVAGQQPAATGPVTTKTVTQEKWRVSKPVIGLAVGIAVLGFAALLALSVLRRRAEAPGEAS